MSDAALATAVARLARLATEDFVIDDMLRQLCEAAAETLAVQGAGVMNVVLGRSRFVHASHPGLEPLERLQENLQSGPCRDAIDSGGITMAGSPAEFAAQWPEFQALAAATGLAAVMAVPLMSRGRCWGSLDLYWAEPHRCTDDELATAQLLADVAVSYLVMASDRAEARAAQEQLASRVLHDQLTGLPNRGLIHELIYHALAGAERHATQVAVLFIDLDKFKDVNDTHGHAVGDQVLGEVARRLQSAVRTCDTVGRLAGDEFVILCEELTNRRDQDPRGVLLKLADRIHTAVAEPLVLADVTLNLSTSIGIAVAADHPSATDLIHDADTAMYEAKALGRGMVVIHDQEGAAGRISRRGAERQFVEALTRNEFRVHYQPVVDGAGEMVAVEALLRWQHPADGLLAAADFIGVAESTGAIVELGHWVIGEALGQLKRWQLEFAALAPKLVFCNVSPRELITADLHAAVAALLTEHRMLPEQLGLEIAEGQLADPRLAATLIRFQQDGHPLAIDDFGTGMSSLARLIDIPVSYLKIDRSLTSRLPDDGRSRTLVQAVITIAADLGVQVISEGVETAGQAEFLRNAGAQLFQGYFHGRPVPADEVTTLLRDAQHGRRPRPVVVAGGSVLDRGAQRKGGAAGGLDARVDEQVGADRSESQRQIPAQLAQPGRSVGSGQQRRQ